jgi:hypothetical protein
LIVFYSKGRYIVWKKQNEAPETDKMRDEWDFLQHFNAAAPTTSFVIGANQPFTVFWGYTRLYLFGQKNGKNKI